MRRAAAIPSKHVYNSKLIEAASLKAVDLINNIKIKLLFKKETTCIHLYIALDVSSLKTEETIDNRFVLLLDVAANQNLRYFNSAGRALVKS